MITKACYHDTLVSIFFYIYKNESLFTEPHFAFDFYGLFEREKICPFIRLSKFPKHNNVGGAVATQHIGYISFQEYIHVAATIFIKAAVLRQGVATGLGKMALRKLANSILQLESDYILNDLWKPRCIVFFFKEQKLNFKAYKREKGVLTPYKKVLYYRR